MPKSDLPFGSEFSPSQIDLATILEIAEAHQSDEKGLEKAVQTAYFDINNSDASDYNRAKLANNTKLGLRAYGIIDDSGRLTTVGQDLWSLRENKNKLYEHLARHILLHKHGSTLVQCIQDMQSSGEQVSLINLRKWLGERGVHFPSAGKHASILRLWLAKAGIFEGKGYRINEARLQEIRGVGTTDFEALAQLNPGQRYFLRALLNLGGMGPYPASEIEKMATVTYGYKFNEKGVAKDILYPLEKAGYILLGKTTRAKSPKVSVTKKLVHEVLEPLLVQLEKLTPSDLRPLLRKPLPDIFAELKSQHKHVKGLALEALAFKLMRLIDLEYVATRLRGTATGGAEVDVIFHSARLAYSRWQVQCKNTASVSLDDVAKEVGLTHMLKSTVIVIVSTGRIGTEARRYAQQIMMESNLAIVMIDRADVEVIIARPAHILEVLTREAKQAMKLKALEI